MANSLSIILFSSLQCFQLCFLSLGQDVSLPAKIDIGRGKIAQGFMVPLVALISALTKHAVGQKIGMSGKITLQYKILPVKGIKEEVLAIRRFAENVYDVLRETLKPVVASASMYAPSCSSAPG